VSKIAIVALGLSADRYFRVAEISGNTSFLFDEVWTVNGFGHVFACDRVFHMDDVRVQAIRAKAGNAKIGHLLEWLRRTKIPVYTSRPLPKLPDLEGIEDAKRILAVLPKETDGQPNQEYARANAQLATLEVEKELLDAGGFESLIAYPLQDVLNKFRCHPYFNNTVAYAIALAAYEGHDMNVYGADFHYPETLGGVVESGRGCCEFWIGQAIAHGCLVNITNGSTLLGAAENCGLYGYDGFDIEGGLDEQGTVKLELKDKPLPSALQIEASYYKGPPQYLERYLKEKGLLAA
jgi:hypothetical protein